MDHAALETLLDELLAQPADTRAAHLQRLALSNPEAAAQLRTWLAGIAGSDGFLETQPSSRQPQADVRVGAWRLLHLLGQGGMGEVWLAERADGAFEKRVAIKFLRSDTPGLRERLQQERRLLARLDHPHIARLLDGGVTDDGAPYLITEYVDGHALDAWCAKNRPDLSQRLALFGAVASAVAYAHANLVVHRDLKPANILVDHDGHAHLLDFGIAKLLDPANTAQTVESALTPQFAAPEQLSGAAITTATDVYALGSLLYQLIAGVAPLDTAGLPLAALVRRVCEEMPAAPSTRTRLAKIPALALRRDLDAIVLKALAKQPRDRYPSVEALLTDIGHARGHRPVAARRAGSAYRARCFLRRHRWPLAIAAMLVAALLAGLTGTIWQARRAAVERDIALAERNRAQEEFERKLATVDFMIAMLGDAAPHDEPVHVGQLLAHTGERLLHDQNLSSAQRLAMIDALAEIHARRRDPQGTEHLLLPLLDSASTPLPNAVAAHLSCYLAEAERDLGKLTDAKRWAMAGALRAAAAGNASHEQHAECLSMLALIAQDEGHLDQALELHRQAIVESDASAPSATDSSAAEHAAYGYSLQLAGRLREAHAEFLRGFAILAARGRSHTIDAAIDLASAAVCDLDLGLPLQADEAMTRATALYREASGASSGLAIQLMRAAVIKIELADAPAALDLLDQSAAMQSDSLGEHSLFAAQLALHRGRALALLGRGDQAQQQFALTQTAYDKLLPALNAYREGLHMAQAEMLLHTEGDDPARLRQAHDLLERAESALRALGTSGRTRLPISLLGQAEVALATAHFDEAASKASEARTLLAADSDSGGWQVAACDAVLVQVQWHVDGNRADAKAQLSAIAQRLQRTLGTRHPRTLAIRNLAATDA